MYGHSRGTSPDQGGSEDHVERERVRGVTKKEGHLVSGDEIVKVGDDSEKSKTLRGPRNPLGIVLVRQRDSCKMLYYLF